MSKSKTKTRYFSLLESLFGLMKTLNKETPFQRKLSGAPLPFLALEFGAIFTYQQINGYLTDKQVDQLKQELKKAPDVTDRSHYTLLEVYATIATTPRDYVLSSSPVEIVPSQQDIEQAVIWDFLAVNKWLSIERAQYWMDLVGAVSQVHGNGFEA